MEGVLLLQRSRAVLAPIIPYDGRGCRTLGVCGGRCLGCHRRHLSDRPACARKFFRSLAERAAKHRREVALATETDAQGNIGDVVTARGEQSSTFLEANSGDVAVRSHPAGVQETLGELARFHAHECCERRQAQVPIEVLVDGCRCSSPSCRVSITSWLRAPETLPSRRGCAGTWAVKKSGARCSLDANCTFCTGMWTSQSKNW